MSQHKIEDEEGRFTFVFGWDQPLQSFYLQKHDNALPKDEQIVVWLGGTPATRIYDINDLTRSARKHGLEIDYTMRAKLYGEKDDGV